MSETLQADCARVSCLLPAFVDGDLTAEVIPGDTEKRKVGGDFAVAVEAGVEGAR